MPGKKNIKKERNPHGESFLTSSGDSFLTSYTAMEKRSFMDLFSDIPLHIPIHIAARQTMQNP
jgi:hypothetical protein